MKRILIKGGLLLLVLASCTAGEYVEIQQTKESSSTSEFSSLFSVSDKELLKIAIVDGAHATTRSFGTQDYVSLLDPVRENDPLLNQFSLEEREYIKKERLSYYEVFEYEDIVPNPDFARLLNSRGEIQVKDSVYRITKYGTLSTHVVNKGKLEIAARQLNDGIFNGRMMPEISIKDSYNRIEADNDESYAMTRTAAEEIPYHTFPSFRSESHTFAGKLLGKVLGIVRLSITTLWMAIESKVHCMITITVCMPKWGHSFLPE